MVRVDHQIRVLGQLNSIWRWYYYGQSGYAEGATWSLSLDPVTKAGFFVYAGVKVPVSVIESDFIWTQPIHQNMITYMSQGGELFSSGHADSDVWHRESGDVILSKADSRMFRDVLSAIGYKKVQLGDRKFRWIPPKIVKPKPVVRIRVARPGSVPQMALKSPAKMKT